MTQINLSNAKIAFLTQGALLQEFSVAGHNLVLGFPTAEPYLKAPYFGETIGRVANRIRGGKISDLNGQSYQLATNEGGKNHLHGGNEGWGHKIFDGPHNTSRNGRDAVLFTYKSPDGEEGYPGTVELRVWYTAFEKQDGGVTKTVLETEYEVELTGKECEETVVNVTNHSYFNIGNNPTIDGTEIELATTQHLPIGSDNIPTGAIEAFSGIEAEKSFTLGVKDPFIDHCFVLDTDLASIPLDTRGRPLRKLISAFHPSTQVHLDVLSTEPGFQLYTGDGVDIAESQHGPALGARAGFCLEPSRLINAINVPDWRRQVVLKQGQVYGSKIVYEAWKA